MRIVLYGTLRKGGKNFWRLPTEAQITTTTLQGYDMYDLGAAPGVKPGKGSITVDIWHKELPWYKAMWLLFRLDMLEAIYLRRYRRVQIQTPQGEAWMYLWRRSVRNKQQITDWIAHRHA